MGAERSSDSHKNAVWNLVPAQPSPDGSNLFSGPIEGAAGSFD